MYLEINLMYGIYVLHNDTTRMKTDSFAFCQNSELYMFKINRYLFISMY